MSEDRAEGPAHVGTSGTGRRVTLADVAADAGVSRALVSIVMRDAPGASTATRDRVLASARSLGYRPDARARSLASQRSGLVGVVFGEAGSFHLDLLEGLYAEAEARGQGLILSALTRGRDETRAVESLQDFRFDALVMLGPATAQPVMAGRMPVVVVGWHVEHPAVDVVRTSDDLGMARAVEHLVALGHRRIAHLDGGANLVADSRRGAYLRAMRAVGLAAEAEVVAGGQTQLDGYRAARAMLQHGELPTAVIAFNDDTAVALLGVLAHEGVAVPERVSVTGWDDSEVACLPGIELTSVAQQPREMARLVMERVVARSEGRPVAERETVLEPALHVRSSTATAP